MLTGYCQLKQITQTAYSIIYRGIRERDNLPVIIKLIKQDYLSIEAIERARQEYELINCLRHPDIITAYELINNERESAIVLENFQGISLGSFSKEKAFSLNEILSITIKIVDAIAAIHTAKIVHQDINSHNILYNQATKELKIIDFSVATQLSKEETNKIDRGRDYRSDYNFLGVILYELLTQKSPSGEVPLSLQQIKPEISQSVSEIVIKLMAKNVADSYQSAVEIKHDLEICLEQSNNTNQISPSNSQYKYELMEAERLRIEGKRELALELYDRAIALAKKNRHIQDEAIANELAAKFYLDWNKQKLAAVYMQEAYYCYQKWGEKVKTDRLAKLYPELLAPILQPRNLVCNPLETLSSLSNKNDANSSSVQSKSSINDSLDLTNILRFARTLTENIEPDLVLQTLSQIILQSSEGDRLIIALENRLEQWEIRIVADRENIQLVAEPLKQKADNPTKLIDYVRNTQETVLVNNLETNLPIIDDYLLQENPHSLVALPLKYQEKTIGVLSLHSTKIANVFSEEQIIILEFFCSQAAVSLYNAQIYADANLKSKAIESSIDGMAILENGVFVYLNKRHVSLFGYKSTELIGKSWTKLYSTAEILRLQQEAFPILEKTGKWMGEATALRKDGTTFSQEVSLCSLDDGKLICVCRDISDRKAFEQQLKFYQFALNRVSDLTFCISPTGQLIYVNEAAIQSLGYTEKELCSFHAVDICPLFTLEVWLSHWQELKQEKCLSFETHLVTNTGEQFSIDVICNYLKFDGQEYSFAIARDISDRQKTKTELINKQNHLEALLNNIPHVSWLKDAESKFISVNKAFSNTLGQTIDRIIGQKDFDLLPSELASKYVADDRLVMESGLSRTVTEKLVSHDGKELWIETYKTPFRDAAGNIAGTVGIGVDITAYKNTQEQLSQSKQLLQLVLDTIPQSVFWKNRDYVYLGCNQKFAKVGGLNSPEEIIGKTDYDLPWKTQESDFFVECDRRIMSTGKAELGIIEPQLTATGKQTWLETNKSPLLDELGNVIGILGTVQDITTQKEAEHTLKRVNEQLEIRVKERTSDLEKTNQALEQSKEKAEIANQSKSVFLANMSHELRTPLNAILGFTQILLRDRSASEEQRTKFNTIHRSGEHLLALINDILDMSKIEAGRMSLNKTNFNTLQMFHSIKEMLLLKAQQKNLNLIFELDSALPEFICTDEQKLRQVIINLLSNAIKFTLTGEIYLRVKPDFNNSQILLFEVEDTGKGIAESEIELLFQPFVQTKSGQQFQEGTGLGLAISRKFVQLMQGDITVRSQLNVGSIFNFEVAIEPALKAESSRSNLERQQIVSLAPNQKNCRILVVDDVKENRGVVKELLSQIGFEVREAINGFEALTHAESWQPDLILMDMRMPIMDGYEAARRIKSSSLTQKIKVIALTASSFDDEREKIFASGCNDFVSKPFKEVDLLDKLAQNLKLDFVYESNSEKIESTEELNPDIDSIFQELSDSWLQQLEKAVIALDESKLYELLAEIEDEHASLAQAIKTKINNFAIDEILPMLHLDKS